MSPEAAKRLEGFPHDGALLKGVPGWGYGGNLAGKRRFPARRRFLLRLAATAWSRGAGAEPPMRERSDGRPAIFPRRGAEASCGPMVRRVRGSPPAPSSAPSAHKGGRSPPTAGGVGRRTSDSRREPRRGLGGAARVAAPSAAWARNLAPPPEPGGRRGSPLFWLSVRRRHKGPGVARGAAVLARGRRFQPLGIVGAGRAGSGHGSGRRAFCGGVLAARMRLGTSAWSGGSVAGRLAGRTAGGKVGRENLFQTSEDRKTPGQG